MQDTAYGLRVTTSLPFGAAIEQTTAALKAQGFGIITTIDMTATLKAKLGKDIRNYTILGACNPVLSDRALEAELEVGLLQTAAIRQGCGERTVLEGEQVVVVIGAAHIIDVIGVGAAHAPFQLEIDALHIELQSRAEGNGHVIHRIELGALRGTLPFGAQPVSYTHLTLPTSDLV